MRRFAEGLKRFAREWTPVVVAVLLIRSFIVESFLVPTGSMLNTIYIGDFMLVNKFIFGAKLPFTDRVIVPASNPKRGDIVVFRFPCDPDVPEDPASPGRFRRIFPASFPFLPLFWDTQTHFFRWYTPNNFVKRCVAVAGDTVEVRNKVLFINGRAEQAPYVIHTDPYRTLPALSPRPENYQRLWQERKFFRSELSPFVRDNFGPVVIPPGHIMAMGDNRDNSEDSRFWGPLELRHVRGKPLVLYFSSTAADNPPNPLRIVLSPWAIRLGRIGRIVR